MTRHFCDICGKEDSSIIGMMFATSEKYYRHLFELQGWRGDVCESCRKKVVKFIKEEAKKNHE